MGQGNLLDVAYGPVMVTAAMVRGAASVIAFNATEEMLSSGNRAVEGRRHSAVPGPVA
jgi:hypothetical protein